MKRSERLRAHGLILDDIMRWKRQEVPARKQEMPEANLRSLVTFTPPPLDFAAALTAPGVSLSRRGEAGIAKQGLAMQGLRRRATGPDLCQRRGVGHLVSDR